MSRQNINIGTTANDGTGDPLRTAFDKINDNFIELYGADNEANTLDANLDVGTHAITTGVTNGDITITPNGTGSIKLGAMKFNGTSLSSDDSTIININEGLVVDGTASISGALSTSTSLALATGATVTGILDEDNMASDSATQLATQQSIKAYVDAQNVAQSITFVGDDSTGTAVNSGETFQIAGGTGLTSAVSSDTMTLAIDSTVATLTGSQTLTNKILTSPTINAATVTGTVTLDSLTFADNTITSNASNANLELDASGTGSIRLIAPTTAVGTLTTADISTTGTHTVSGQSDIDTVRIKDNTITTNASNANLQLSANGTGVVDVQNAMTTIGQTVTGNMTIDGQFDVDNISINGNGIIATNSNGGININPNGTGSVTIGGSNVSVPSTLTASTLYAETQILLGDGAKIMPAATDSDLQLDTIGTGIVTINNLKVDGNIQINDNKIATTVSNSNLQLGANGSGKIELMSSTIERTGDIIFDATSDIILDAGGKDIIFRYDGVQFGLFTFAGGNLLIQSGSTTMLTGDGANAIFNGNITVPGSSTLDGVTITDNTIKTNASNADLQLGTNGTGVIDILTATQTTVGSAGGANALPGTPTGYIKVKIGGTMRVIPFYDES